MTTHLMPTTITHVDAAAATHATAHDVKAAAAVNLADRVLELLESTSRPGPAGRHLDVVERSELLFKLLEGFEVAQYRAAAASETYADAVYLGALEDYKQTTASTPFRRRTFA